MIRKKSSIIFDDKPIENSENAITSGGVFTAIQQSGGGGTSDYSQLTNKPQINNIELVGNKSLATLGIASSSEITTINSTIQGINADIIDLQEGKADKSQLPNMDLYATKLEAQSIADRVTENESDIATLENDVANKADSSTVTALTSRVSTNEASIGNLSNLTTTAKTDIVSALNEVDSDLANKADSSTVTALTSRVSTNEASIGNLSNLTTTAKTDLVSAINEIASGGGGSLSITTETKTANFVNGCANIQKASSETSVLIALKASTNDRAFLQGSIPYGNTIRLYAAKLTTNELDTTYGSIETPKNVDFTLYRLNI